MHRVVVGFRSQTAQLVQVTCPELLHLCFLSQPVASLRVMHRAARKYGSWGNVLSGTSLWAWQRLQGAAVSTRQHLLCCELCIAVETTPSSSSVFVEALLCLSTNESLVRGVKGSTRPSVGGWLERGGSWEPCPCHLLPPACGNAVISPVALPLRLFFPFYQSPLGSSKGRRQQSL